MAGSGIFCLWWRFLFSIFGRQGDPGYCNNWQIWPYREIFFFHSCQKASCPFIQPTHNNDQPHNWFNRCQREMTGMWAQLPNSEGVASMWKNPSLRKTAAWGSHESGSLGVPRRKTGSATGTAWGSVVQPTRVSSNNFQKSKNFPIFNKSFPISADMITIWERRLCASFHNSCNKFCISCKSLVWLSPSPSALPHWPTMSLALHSPLKNHTGSLSHVLSDLIQWFIHTC